MKRIVLLLTVVLAAVLLTGCGTVFYTDGFTGSCEVSAVESMAVPADGVRSLLIDAGAGRLDVVGRHGATEVTVQATKCATSQRLLDELEVRAERVGNSIQVETFSTQVTVIGSSPTIDLVVEVPDSLMVQVHDGSGSMRLQQLLGEVQVDDGSGTIEILDVAGPITVIDGSGDMDIRRVQGDVHVRDDGSGDIQIYDVGGNVTIDHDGSGSIEVRNVRGDFTVGDDGSGSLQYDAIGGRVRIPAH